MSTIINNTHIQGLHIQISNITRYFRSNCIEEEASTKLYKLIRKITRVRQLSQLTISQYNIIMHHLQRLEDTAYLYYWAVSFLDRTLLRQMLECNIIANTQEYTRKSLSAEELDKVQKKSKSMINFDRLFEF